MQNTFRDLRVWQQAMDLAVAIYRITEAFPKRELYGLSQQMRRAGVSVASNMAEGKGRRHDKEFRQFLFHARGSLLELETQLTIAARLEYVPTKQAGEIQQLATQVGRSLTGLVNSLASVA
jgi:four helix bundle protein